MALIKCKECGHDVSSEASQCPNCGFPVKTSSNKSRKKWLVGGIVVLVTLSILIAVIYNSSFKIAMTSYDYKEVGKSISAINNPRKLWLISDRCSRLAELNKLKSDITTDNNQKKSDSLVAAINWNSLALEADEKILAIVHGKDALKRHKAEMQIDSLKTSLNLYKLDAGTYPETKQGLSALRQIPTTGKIPKNWRGGGYVFKEERFIDPWGNKLIYKSPGRYSDYEIISYGADGRPGGDHENEDIKFSAP